ncbi:MAG TPA: metal-sulfur cluster assembly factor, partial [Actinomycetota bacterium]|nr:metal-sulfur cluster assembly factor [Actinomycetota bacterium]
MSEQREMNESAGETWERSARGDGNGAAADPGILKEQILQALKNVVDPELGINIVDLGLVYGVDLKESNVHITYTLTTMGCPIGPL